MNLNKRLGGTRKLSPGEAHESIGSWIESQAKTYGTRPDNKEHPAKFVKEDKDKNRDGIIKSQFARRS